MNAYNTLVNSNEAQENESKMIDYTRNIATLNFYLNKLYKTINNLISTDKNTKSTALREVMEYVKSMYPAIKNAFYLDDNTDSIYDSIDSEIEEFSAMKNIDAEHKYSGLNDILISLIPCGVEGSDISEVLTKVVEEYYLDQFENRLEKFVMLESLDTEKDVTEERENIVKYVSNIYPSLQNSYKDLQKINKDYPKKIAEKSEFLGNKRKEALVKSDEKNGIDQKHRYAALNDSLLGLIAFNIPKENINEMLQDFLEENSAKLVS